MRVSCSGATAGRVCSRATCSFFGGFIALQNIWDCDLQAHIRSLERLRGLGVDMFFPGHLGLSLKDGQRHIDAALARLDRLSISMTLL
jgi:hypothetical protein